MKSATLFLLFITSSPLIRTMGSNESLNEIEADLNYLSGIITFMKTPNYIDSGNLTRNPSEEQTTRHFLKQAIIDNRALLESMRIGKSQSQITSVNKLMQRCATLTQQLTAISIPFHQKKVADQKRIIETVEQLSRIAAIYGQEKISLISQLEQLRIDLEALTHRYNGHTIVINRSGNAYWFVSSPVKLLPEAKSHLQESVDQKMAYITSIRPAIADTELKMEFSKLENSYLSLKEKIK